jgi:mannosyltransferase
VSPETAERRHRLAPGVLLAGLIVLATVLRFWRLGHWGLEGDEIFTYQDSLSPQLNNPRPLIYFLNYYVVRPLVPLNELGLRLLPALSGVLAVPALYGVVQRLTGTRAALFSALLLSVNPVHLYQSQYARYWPLVFLFSAVYPYSLYLGLRDRDRRLLGLGALTTVLAVLAHPVSILLLGGLGLWVLTRLRREHLKWLWGQKTVRWALSLMVILAGVIVVVYVPMLHAWIVSHDVKARLPDHLLFAPSQRGIKQIAYLLAYVDSLTLPLVLTGMVGIYLLWLEGNRSLAILLACLFIFPVAFIVLLSFRTAVSLTYIFSTAPIFFVGAGVFLDRLAGLDWELRPRWLLSATVAVLIIAAGAPTLISQYRDGRRLDFRTAARWLDEHLNPGDAVFSDQFRTMRHYLRGVQARHLSADPAPLTQALDLLQQSGHGALWVVAPYSSQGGHRTNPKLGSFKAWIYQNCQLRTAIGVARLDFRQNELQIYRCPPLPPVGSFAQDGDSSRSIRPRSGR